ncbi:oligopeptide ABC transporter substrate-binding protein [Shouchella lehensis]|uniref:Oligopeptide ABC transporter substrate-binding protein n=1 Tax=Shouchella lehensis TaxID=300825 RepID=A0A4Y7WS09_9BACI|nr:oligopeptide ABC transporter substrate-binding protein [Shouchella lehensis]MBG9783676.1 ABC transporter substrate-binding protein [Shouchella lehensis]TES51376.1 oligopeptide ABC transporter substrate-binding protein [Shouchella lehensis]
MKKLLKPKFYLAPTLVAVLALAACSDNGDGGGSSEPSGTGEEEGSEETIENEDGIYSLDDFEPTKTADGEAIEGGTLNVGVVASSPFEGTLDWQHYSISTDNDIIQFFSESLFTMDEAFNITDEGAATIDVSEDNLTYTITIKDNVNWHDGEPVKAEDFVFAHEVIGHKDYDGVRYDASFRNIVGMEEYHNEEADDISGFNIIDEKTVELTFKEATPSLMSGGIWYYAMPKHYFEGVEVADMSSSDQVRREPLGYGPFVVENIVPGESVTLSKNEDYWQGAPLVDEVVLTVVNPDVVVESLKTGQIDIVTTFPATQFADNADMSNVDWLGRVSRGYQYTGFKLGTWDADAGEVSYDPDSKMANESLREAVRLAVNYEELGNRMYNGLRFPATTVIPPYHALYHDDANPGFDYDPERAKELLAEAGYEDLDGDGFVEDPNGEEFVITYAARQGDATAEAVSNYEMQAWRDIGLNIELLEGSLTEPNAFYDRIEEDDPAIDMYSAGWNVGSDVDPSGIFGSQSMFNYPRYTDDTLEEILADGLSEDAFEQSYRQDVYNQFQAHINEVLPLAPTLYQIDTFPINNRVSGISYEVGNNDYGWHTVQLNDENAAVD